MDYVKAPPHHPLLDRLACGDATAFVGGARIPIAIWQCGLGFDWFRTGKIVGDPDVLGGFRGYAGQKWYIA